MGTAESQARLWVRGDNGIIRISITSDGAMGDEWRGRLRDHTSGMAGSALLSSSFVDSVTNGVTREVVILPGSLFPPIGRTTKFVRDDAKRRGLVEPNPEIACLMAEMVSDRDLENMGLRRIVFMHPSIEIDLPNPVRSGRHVLAIMQSDPLKLRAPLCRDDSVWADSDGLAFCVGPIRERKD